MVVSCIIELKTMRRERLAILAIDLLRVRVAILTAGRNSDMAEISQSIPRTVTLVGDGIVDFHMILSWEGSVALHVFFQSTNNCPT
jgi:hypothetical protein